MTTYIEKLLDRFIVEKEQKQYREAPADKYREAVRYEKEALTDLQRTVRRLAYMLKHEKPVVYPDEKIVLLRTVTTVPEIFTEREFEGIKKEHYIHEQGKVCNINPAYDMLIAAGFDKKREEIKGVLQVLTDDAEDVESSEKREYLNALLEVLDLITEFADRYRKEAERVGNTEAAEVLSRIPAKGAENFREALQFLRLVHYCLWSSFNYHNTFGRFDQYMYSYYINDIENGILDKETALELIEEFFISCNKDSDLYTGMQQGDNGQSMVLGGLNIDGTESYNDLSDLCLQASLELKLIDPKINLRVNKNTPVEMYEKGTMLTKQGLGFPQYANDDVIIPALKRWGYEEQDAYNYVVAACWEFIIPGRGMDIPNVNGLSFAHAVISSMEKLPQCTAFEEFLEIVKAAVSEQAVELMESAKNVYMEPAPLMSLMMEGSIGRAQDVSKGNKYNNYGIHGTGLSTAVDSLAAIEKYVFKERAFTAEELLTMLDHDFAGKEEVQNMLRFEAPKMGNDDDAVDGIAVKLLDWFADSLEGVHNDRGGIFRAGTGSAMYYIWHARAEVPTADGRRRGEALACNYSPSLFTRLNGPISIIKSFSKPHLMRVANGGPLTIELHDTLFRNEDSIRKVAMFVKSFMDMGGHQMQINAVNRDKMKDAKAHPENYRNLIVRVWGWSGYFVELDEVYQDHIIERMELGM
ncbi:MAG: pyruvate formate lyase family protein [Lachnospiraceae bacterium]|nr:pyruvate formate lyase family protein [Lachnospiraceae bacterium]